MQYRLSGFVLRAGLSLALAVLLQGCGGGGGGGETTQPPDPNAVSYKTLTGMVNENNLREVPADLVRG